FISSLCRYDNRFPSQRWRFCRWLLAQLVFSGECSVHGLCITHPTFSTVTDLWGDIYSPLFPVQEMSESAFA
ncbi:hypothetical protein PFISCL1PPCAC_17292, partial [Pristionchus fissidentatus]